MPIADLSLVINFSIHLNQLTPLAYRVRLLRSASLTAPIPFLLTYPKARVSHIQWLESTPRSLQFSLQYNRNTWQFTSGKINWTFFLSPPSRDFWEIQCFNNSYLSYSAPLCIILRTERTWPLGAPRFSLNAFLPITLNLTILLGFKQCLQWSCKMKVLTPIH